VAKSNFLGFRFSQKITAAYLLIFLFFFLLLFPFVPKTVDLIMQANMLQTETVLIKKMQQASNIDDMIEKLKEREYAVVHRMSIIDSSGYVLYDSHLERLTGKKPSKSYRTAHPEVLEALRNKKGEGYSEKYSVLFAENFAYVAKAFNFQSKRYVLRMAFPLKYVQHLSRKFEIGFIALASLVLVLFGVMTWLIINHITKPIRKIIAQIAPYQEGKLGQLPHITVPPHTEKDEFFKLASTLNKLSDRIQEHINAITKERDIKMSILESLHEGLISIDHQGQIEDINLAASHFMKFSKNDLQGQNIHTLKNSSPNLIVQTVVEMFEQSDSMAKKSNEKTLYIDEKTMVVITMLPNRKTHGATFTIRDTTSQMQVIQLGKQFVANASHELKTPITIVRGFAETLHEHPDLPMEKRQEITEKIEKNCERMDTLIKSLLTLTQIENISFQEMVVPCNLYEIIQNCTHILQSVYPKAEVSVEPKEANSADFTILGEPDLIELTLYNFLNNAAKYSKELPKIRVSLEQRREKIYLSIADEGVGIPKKDLDHIFERFFRVDKARTRHMGGAGLGLAIAKTVLEKHNAQVSVQSQLGVGTTFTLIFNHHP
jgi:two-component system, OmpR family, phosphate regulon sensor histidine kinase PhoR